MGNGSVTTNYGYVYNQGGTVTDNESSGTVVLRNGTVENNYGTVYVVEPNVSVSYNANSGTVYWALTTAGTNKEQADFSNLTTFDKAHGYTFIKDGCVITAKDNYRFKSDPNGVSHPIYLLRKHIEPDPERPTYIQTVYRSGYRFTPNFVETCEMCEGSVIVVS